MLTVDNLTALATVTGLTDGQQTRLLGGTTAFDDKGAELFYRATGRTAITVDSVRYFTAGGTDDYFEAFFTASASMGSGGNLYAADVAARDALFVAGVLAQQEIIVREIGNYIMLQDYTGPFSGATSGVHYEFIEFSADPKVTSQGPMLGGNGEFVQPLVIGDAYNASNGNQLVWIVAELTGEAIGSCGCKFGVVMEDRNGVMLSQSVVDGALSDEGGGFWKCLFDVKTSDTSDLLEGWHVWSVQLEDSAGELTTRVGGSNQVETTNNAVMVVREGTL